MKLECKRYNLYLDCWLQFWFDAVLEGLKHAVSEMFQDQIFFGPTKITILWDLSSSTFRGLMNPDSEIFAKAFVAVN